MIEERLDRMEGILSQLVTMVGNLHTVQEEMLKTLKSFDSRIGSLEEKVELAEKRFEAMDLRFDSWESEFKSLNSKFASLEEKSEERHKEMVGHFKNLKVDQDFIWEKAVRNERELEILKRRSLS